MYKYLILLIGLFLVACGSEEKKGFKIEGTITNADGQTLYFEKLTPTTGIILDSIKLTEGNSNFSFGGRASEKMFYRLKLTQTNFITLIVDSLEKVSLTADAVSLINTVQIVGSEDSKALLDVNRTIVSNKNKMDSLNRVFQQAYGADNFQEIKAMLEEQFLNVKNELDNKLVEFTKSHGGSLVALFAVNQIDRNVYADDYIRVGNDLLSTLPNSQYVEDYNKRLEPLRKSAHLAIGKVAPELTLANPEGEPLSLSSFRGKIVMIDFWASWCKPCRLENPNVVRLYKKYHDKGFEIFGVSLDKDKNSWLAAIKQDNITWPQVSDLGAWKSEAVRIYGISSIPYTILLDKDGKIINKGLRGRNLESRVEELLGQAS